MSNREYIELFATLGLGAFTIVVSVARFTVTHVAAHSNAYWCMYAPKSWTNNIDLFGTIEQCTAIIVVCLPVLKSLLRRRKNFQREATLQTSALDMAAEKAEEA